MDLLELFTFVRQFSLHFLGSDEKILQETPTLLHLNETLHHVINSSEVHFPGLDLLFEVPDVLGEQHIVNQ